MVSVILPTAAMKAYRVLKLQEDDLFIFAVEPVTVRSRFPLTLCLSSRSNSEKDSLQQPFRK